MGDFIIDCDKHRHQRTACILTFLSSPHQSSRPETSFSNSFRSVACSNNNTEATVFLLRIWHENNNNARAPLNF